MTTVYTKSLTSDFGGNLNTSQLQDEIKNNGGISPECLIVYNHSDDVEIKFANTLSGSEQTTLNSIISSHTPSDNYGIELPLEVSVDPRRNKFSSSNYSRVMRMELPSISKAKCIITSYKQTKVTSYNIKIIDLTNDSILLETVCSNNSEEATDLGMLQNLPDDPFSVEVQVKRNSGSGRVFIENVTIQYAD